MLNRLRLENFKTHQYLDVSFDPGLNSIVGPNAAGKSSLLKAVLYSLYGTEAAGAKDHLTTWGEASHKAVLDVYLPKYGPCTITRTPTSATVLDVNGTMLASGKTAVTGFIEAALGISFKDFKLLTYSQQGDTQALLAMGAVLLQKRVEEIASVDLLDKVLRFISADLSELKGGIAALQGISDVGSLQKTLNDMEVKAKDLGGNLTSLIDTLGAFDQELGETDNKYRADLSLSLQIGHATDQKEALLRYLQDTTSALEEAKAAMPSLPAPSPESIDQLSRQIENARSQLDAAKANVESARKLREVIQQGTAWLEQSAPALRVHTEAVEWLAEHAALLDEIASKEQAAKQRKDTALNKLQAAKQAVQKAVCQECRRPFSPEELAQARIREDEAHSEFVVEDQAHDRILRDHKAWQIAKQSRVAKVSHGLEDRFILAQEQVKKASEALSTYPTQEELSNRVGVLSALLAGLQSQDQEDRKLAGQIGVLQGRIATMEQGIRAQQSELARVEQTLLDLGPAPDLEKAGAELAHMKERSRSLHEERNRLESLLAQRTGQISALRAQIADAEEQHARLAHYSARVAKIGQLDWFLRKNRSKWLADIWEGVLLHASFLVNLTTEGVISAVQRSESGEFTVTENSRTVPVSELSGAQRSITGLCLRLAITRLFYGSNGLFLLLDEVTADCRDDNAARVAGMLQSVGMQCLLVTHREGDAVNAGNLIAL